jgi:hypothetical protein
LGVVDASKQASQLHDNDASFAPERGSWAVGSQLTAFDQPSLLNALLVLDSSQIDLLRWCKLLSSRIH